MNVFTTTEAIHRIYISATALLFNLVLCIFIGVLNQGDEHDRVKNRSFGMLSYVVLFGNLLTCIVSFARRADSVHMPDSLSYLSYLITDLANIYVTSFFAQYIENFFSDKHKPNRVLYVFNKALTVAATLLMILLYLWKFPSFTGVTNVEVVEPWVRYVFGYAIELYFIIYTAVYFIRHGRLLNRRAFLTAMWAIILTVAGIVMQLIFKNVLLNYVGAVLGLYLFYFGVETPDYRKLIQTMDELREARVTADNANRSKSDFLANMSHEIRTPINAVLGMNEMIIRECRDEDIIGYARNIESSGKNLLNIINDILDFSKIEAGRLEIIEAPYKLSTVIGDVTNMVKLKTEDKGLELEVYVDETLPNKLMGDEVRIRQILTNLLANAVKYTKEGRISLTVEGSRDSAAETDDGSDRNTPYYNKEETRSDEQKELMLTMSVEDTGIGIREEDLDRLFTQFERMDMVQNRTVEGTGLGLAITRDLTEMMGGSIDVRSVYGQGSTFTVNIPQRIVSDEPIGDLGRQLERSLSDERGYKESFRAPDARVLVVDDTRLNLMVFKELLKKTEVQVDTADGAREALSMTAQVRYDIIFMDQRMPHMDGTQTMKTIRSQKHNMNAHTRIICLTADAVSGARERYLSEGFDDYLTKPVNGDELEGMLVRYLPRDKVMVINS